MQPLSPERLVQMWEQGRHRHPVDRALQALALACPERSSEELVGMPIGMRDAELLQLRCLTFGHGLNGYTDCPRCNERLEFTIDSAALSQGSPAWQADQHISVNDALFRLPTSRDLALIAGETDPQQAARRLLTQCCIAPWIPSMTLTRVNGRRPWSLRPSSAWPMPTQVPMSSWPFPAVTVAITGTRCSIS